MDKDSLVNLLQENIEEKLKDAKAMGGDLKSLIRSTTINTLENYDFVTKEEFETQKTILERAEAKVKQLEQKISELQNNYKS
ncbi:MAG: accessory factor UbiK family protein [Pseudomonadota bacterium]|nr:accessory factor UbiK family protein [Pseudomonadota bacterium]